MRRTRSRSVGVGLLGVGLVNVKKKVWSLWLLTCADPGRQGCSRLTRTRRRHRLGCLRGMRLGVERRIDEAKTVNDDA